MAVLTASGKEQALANFYAQLKRDGMTATELARRAGVGRAYLIRVLNRDTSGRNTWKHILPLLSDEALFHLKQCSAWNEHANAASFRFDAQPEVRVGRFTVRKLGHGKVWLDHPDGGMETAEKKLESTLTQFWRKHF
jgi:hypothetical protein